MQIAIRTGVNSGEVVAGDAAEGQALVTGDAVNVAARLQQAAAAGETLIGDATRQLVGEELEAEAVEPLVVRGKAEPLTAWRLVGTREHARGGPAARCWVVSPSCAACATSSSGSRTSAARSAS